MRSRMMYGLAITRKEMGHLEATLDRQVHFYLELSGSCIRMQVVDDDSPLAADTVEFQVRAADRPNRVRRTRIAALEAPSLPHDMIHFSERIDEAFTEIFCLFMHLHNLQLAIFAWRNPSAAYKNAANE